MDRALVTTALALALSGCGASLGARSSGAGAAAAVPQAVANLAATHVGGIYAGTISLSGLGTGTLSMDVAPFGSTYGGSIVAKYKIASRQGVLVLTGASSKLSGTLILPLNAPCSYAVSSAYDNAKFTLHGKLRGSAGCKTRSGSFTAVQACYFRPATLDALDRPRTLGIKPC